MQLHIEPDLDPDEQKALTLALERLLSGALPPAAYRSDWRQAGIAENLESEPPDYGEATERPRSNPGATRA